MAQTKQAVKQQQDNTLNVQTVLINKKQSSFLVPDFTENQKLAVVDEGVLKYLKELLPKANAYEIINNFIERMEKIRNYPCTLKVAVQEAKDFVAFHETVNLMDKYFNPNVTVTLDEPFNVEKPAPTIDELILEWSKLEGRIAGELGGNQSIIDYATSKEHMEWLVKNGHMTSAPVEAVKINHATV